MRLTHRDKYGRWCSDGSKVSLRLGCPRENDPSILWGDIVDKLAVYEDAEEQGRLVILPCKVGDTVYVLRCGLGANFLSVYPSSVIGFKIGRIENTIEVDPSYQGYSECYSVKDWGVYVFPTREEAEAALKGEKDK